MKKPFLDEEYLEKIIQNGFSGGRYNFWDCVGLAQYYIWIEGYKKLRTKTAILKFCREHDPEFNEVISRKSIKSAIDLAMKKKPDKIVDVVVTMNEIARIKEVRDYKIEKFLFSLLVMAKRQKFDNTILTKRRNQNGYFVKVDDAFLVFRKLAFRMSKDDFPLFVHEYVNKEYFGATKVGKIAILYADDNSVPVVKVTGDKEPIAAYIEMNGGELIYCRNPACGNLVKKESNRQVYCKPCGAARRRENSTRYMREYRQGKND